jgi:predicted enzyme related to lactoylglutathione lyase
MWSGSGAAVTRIEPELWVDGAGEAVAFYEAAFGATVVHRVGEGDDIVAQPGGVVRVVGEQVNDRPHLSGEQRQLSHIQSWFIVPAFA